MQLQHFHHIHVIDDSSTSIKLLVDSCVRCSMQFVREFAKLGLTRSVGGVLALALSRELTPVVTCIILAGAISAAYD